MQVNLLSIVQSIALDTGMMKSSLVIELPNGEVATLLIDDVTMDAILRAQRNEPPSPLRTPQQEIEPGPPPGPAPTYGVEGDDAELVPPADADSTAVFGGEPPPQPPPQPQQRNRARHVPANEWGYPQPQREAGAQDPGEVVGGGADADEDGVSSI